MDRFYEPFETVMGRVEFKYYPPPANPKRKPQLCRYAQAFSEWTDWLFREIVTEEPDALIVNQAMLLLVKQYFEWRNEVTKRHKDYMGDRIRGHICIYQVFVQAYHKLRVIELRLQKPLLFMQPPPPKPKTPDRALFLGEEE